jgi:hypothetical protein
MTSLFFYKQKLDILFCYLIKKFFVALCLKNFFFVALETLIIILTFRKLSINVDYTILISEVIIQMSRVYYLNYTQDLFT